MVNISWPRIGHFGKIKRWKLKIQCQKKTFLKKGGISAHSQNWLDPRKGPTKATMSPVFQWTKIWSRRSGEKVRFIFWSIFIKYLIFIHLQRSRKSEAFCRVQSTNDLLWFDNFFYFGRVCHIKRVFQQKCRVLTNFLRLPIKKMFLPNRIYLLSLLLFMFAHRKFIKNSSNQGVD